MKKLKKGDRVIVITGKDKGRVGEIVSFVSSDKILVSGVAVVKEHQKPNPNLNKQGGIISKESPINVSNVAIYNQALLQRDKICIREIDGQFFRVYRSSGEKIVYSGN